ncbi:substrate-binding domain-containing protein [Verrucomicrobiaceae bacterium N1E253]|uniref:Substrate-binding domain-containing protein n=2 Tax=Oceaniferula marina TaxID=2748318 RepID=A0A851GGP8_9BACT|nr:substrate-binding domain-containing protein [Oceaniferula marina]
MEHQIQERGVRRGVLLALNWYHPKLHHGIARFAAGHGWHLEAGVALGGDPFPAHWHGMGVIAAVEYRKKIKERYPWVGGNLVLVGHTGEDVDEYHSVSDDHCAIVEQAIEHFQAKGFRQFACYCPSRDLVGVRVNHFVKVLKEQGMPCCLLVADSGDWLSRHHWLMEELSQLPAGTAVFCQNDEFATEVIEACLDAGIGVPDRLAVIGVRNDPLICDSLQIPLSSVDNNLFQVGYRAAELLESLFQGVAGKPAHHKVAPSGVRARASTSLLAGELRDPEFHRAMKVIRTHFTRPEFDCPMLANLCSVSLRKLYLIFQRSHVRKPAEEIRYQRVAMARNLLRTITSPVEVVSERCGFGNIRSFYMAFRDVEGATPAAFRKGLNRQTEV